MTLRGKVDRGGGNPRVAGFLREVWILYADVGLSDGCVVGNILELGTSYIFCVAVAERPVAGFHLGISSWGGGGEAHGLRPRVDFIISNILGGSWVS